MWMVRLVTSALAAGALLGQGNVTLEPATGSVLPAGDPIRGKAIFEGEGACLGCHRVRDNGSRFGPDLTDIGARTGNTSFLRGRIGRGPGGRGAFVGRGGATPAPAAPDAGAASRAQAELERALLDPGAEILPSNRTVRLVTRTGQLITARVLNQDTFSLQLIDTKEQVMSIQKSDLREFAYIKNSPMPSYRDKFSAQELADVIAYLVSLKGVNK